MRTANLAIVFTDIVGYADRLSRQTYEQSQRMLRLHEALVLPVFRAYRYPMDYPGLSHLDLRPGPTIDELARSSPEDR